MKKILCLFTVMLFLFCFAGCAYIYQNEETFQKAYNSTPIHITVDNRSVVMSKPLEHIDGHLLAPMREFSELISAEIYWDSESHTASAWRGDYYIEFCMGDRQYLSGTKWAISQETLDIAPMVIDGTAYIPLRAMAEALDFSVIWEEDSKTISLTDKATEIELGYANTPELFFAEIDKNVKKMTPIFTIITTGLPIETLEMDIQEYFTDIDALAHVFHEMKDGTIGVTYKVYYRMHARILNAHRINNTDELDESELSVYKKALQIVSEHTTTYMTDYEKEISLHDYIVKNTQYSYEALEAINRGEYVEHVGTPYGALINGAAVCSGYSSAFKLLMELSDIECDIIHGTAGGDPHAWNRVKLAEKYYLVDVTWDDPDDESLPDFVEYDYFNLTDEKMNQERVPISISEKKADSTFYNYYYYNRLLVEPK